MPIVHYPGYVTKKHIAAHYKVKVNTVSEWMRENSCPHPEFSYVIIDGVVCIKNSMEKTVPPSNIILSELELASKVAARHKIRGHQIYEAIIAGDVTGVVIMRHVFVMGNEPALLEVLKVKRRKRP